MNEEPKDRPHAASTTLPMKSDGERLLVVQRQFREQVARAGESSDIILHAMRGIAAATHQAIEKSGKGLHELREMETSVKKIGLRGAGIGQRIHDFETGMQNFLSKLQGLGGGLRELLQDNSRISDQSKTLSSLTSEIDQKVDGVVASSEQITLLALNAVIAANRAGKYGQAFSVVANEVQTLAERSAVAAGEIRSLASSIQGEVKAVFESIEKIGQGLSQGIGHSDSQVAQMATLSQEIARIRVPFGKIETSLQETQPLTEGMRRTGERVAGAAEEFSRRIRKALAASETQRECYGTIDLSLEALRESAQVLLSLQKPEEAQEVISQVGFAVGGIADMVGGMDQAIRESVAGIHEIAEVSSREVEQVLQFLKERDKLKKPLTTLRKETEHFHGSLTQLDQRFEKDVLQGMEVFVGSAEKTWDEVRSALERIRGLRSHARHIQKIAWEISLIIQETNVMAFNGSVEAVRAGQFGRNFSQVANDVRDLARESIQAADRIQDLVQDIQDQLAVMVQTLGDTGSKAGGFFENSQQLLQNLRLVRHQLQGLQEDVVHLEHGGKSSEEFLSVAGSALESMVVAVDTIAKSSLTSRTEARERAQDMQRLQERVQELKSLDSALQAKGAGAP